MITLMKTDNSMKWTNEELNNMSIIKRINDRADIIADQLILKHEGYKLPALASEWNSKQSKDYRHYFNTVRDNIMDDYNLLLNEEIRQEYKLYMEEKERHINEMIEWNREMELVV